MLVRPLSWIYLEPSTSKLLYILVYNSFWLAPVSPRLTIVLVAGKLLGVVRIASHGSNMGFVGESEDRPFGENGRRHGTVCSQALVPIPFGARNRNLGTTANANASGVSKEASFVL